MMIDLKYLFEKWDIKCNGILMCGANTAQERFVYAELGIPEVIWIEAIPSIYEQAKENLIPFHNQIIINACISNKDNEQVLFNISNNESQSSSFLELAHHKVIHPEVRYIDSIILPTVRLDTLFSEADITHINFFSADLQGVELLALQGLGELINQFDYIYLEVNKCEVYKDCATIDQIDQFLSDFERVETGTWVADSWTDSLYIRRSLLHNN